jgi:hypothetical protein
VNLTFTIAPTFACAQVAQQPCRRHQPLGLTPGILTLIHTFGDEAKMEATVPFFTGEEFVLFGTACARINAHACCDLCSCFACPPLTR